MEDNQKPEYRIDDALRILRSGDLKAFAQVVILMKMEELEGFIRELEARLKRLPEPKGRALELRSKVIVYKIALREVTKERDIRVGDPVYTKRINEIIEKERAK